VLPWPEWGIQPVPLVCLGIYSVHGIWFLCRARTEMISGNGGGGTVPCGMIIEHLPLIRDHMGKVSVLIVSHISLLFRIITVHGSPRGAIYKQRVTRYHDCGLCVLLKIFTYITLKMLLTLIQRLHSPLLSKPQYFRYDSINLTSSIPLS